MSSENNNGDPKMNPGLVVTVSREKGCGAVPISQMIIDKLNSISYDQERNITWKLISKEILEQSAEHLEITPSEVDSIIDMNVLRRLALSFSQKSLPDDKQVKNTIRDVILNAANQGNVIIVGRAGVGITRNHENSLHIRLIAPYEWRVRQIATNENITIKAADKIVKERDKQRDVFNQYFSETKDADSHPYDLTLNVSTMQDHEVADAIFSVIKARQDALLHSH